MQKHLTFFKSLFFSLCLGFAMQSTASELEPQSLGSEAEVTTQPLVSSSTFQTGMNEEIISPAQSPTTSSATGTAASSGSATPQQLAEYRQWQPYSSMYGSGMSGRSFDIRMDQEAQARRQQDFGERMAQAQQERQQRAFDERISSRSYGPRSNQGRLISSSTTAGMAVGALVGRHRGYDEEYREARREARERRHEERQSRSQERAQSSQQKEDIVEDK